MMSEFGRRGRGCLQGLQRPAMEEAATGTTCLRIHDVTYFVMGKHEAFFTGNASLISHLREQAAGEQRFERRQPFVFRDIRDLAQPFKRKGSAQDSSSTQQGQGMGRKASQSAANYLPYSRREYPSYQVLIA